MEYQYFSFDSKASIEKMLLSKNTETISQAILGAVNGIDDWQWLQQLCLTYSNHANYWVAKNAITSLGSIARIFGELDVALVLAKFKEVKDPELQVVIDCAIEDIEIFKGKG
jgi:hypothetical protein